MSWLKRIVIGLFFMAGLLLTGSALAQTLFKKSVKREVEQLFKRVENPGEVVREEELTDLPESVQRWFRYTGIIGKEKVHSARLKQEAEMKLTTKGSWMPVKAEQYVTTQEPAFIWEAAIQVAPFLHISGKDTYQDGRGNMLIKPMSLITLANSQGEEIDQGTQLRFLAETIWFPSALLNDYISWREIDPNNVKATITYGGVSSSGVFTIDDRGHITQFEAQRYGSFNGEFRLETWSIRVSDYNTFEETGIPTKGEITWKLADGDFNWFRFNVTDIQYNVLAPY